jgi:hypothetical protein
MLNFMTLRFRGASTVDIMAECRRRGYDSRNVDDREIRCVAQIGHAVVPSGDLVDRADRSVAERQLFHPYTRREQHDHAQLHDLALSRGVYGRHSAMAGFQNARKACARCASGTSLLACNAVVY